MRCPPSGDETPHGKRFYEDPGAPLASVCPACGGGLTPGKAGVGNLALRDCDPPLVGLHGMRWADHASSCRQPGLGWGASDER